MKPSPTNVIRDTARETRTASIVRSVGMVQWFEDGSSIPIKAGEGDDVLLRTGQGGANPDPSDKDGSVQRFDDGPCRE